MSYQLLDDEPSGYQLLDDEPKKESLFEKGAKAFYDFQMSGLKGASRIGSTLMAIPELAESGLKDLMGVKREGPMTNMDARNKAVTEGLRSMGVDTESMAGKAGDIAMQIAGTAGAGGALGLGAKAAGMTRLGEALATGGMGTGQAVSGFAPRVADIGIRTAGGGLGGAASAGLVDPNDAGFGGAVGAALPVPAQLTGKLYQRFFGGRTNAAGNVMNKVAGDDMDAIIARLEADRSIVPGSQATAGQAASDVGNAPFSALDEIVSGESGSSANIARIKANEVARAKILLDIAKTPAEYDAAKKELLRVTTPMREDALNQANIAGVIQPKLESEIAQKQASKIDALQNYGQLATESVQQQAGANAILDKTKYSASLQDVFDKNPGVIHYIASLPQDERAIFVESLKNGESNAVNKLKNLGYLGDVRAARKQERGAEYFSGAEDFGSVAQQRQAEKNFKQAQLDSLEREGFRKLDGGAIVGKIDQILGTPGDRAVTLNQQILGNVKDKIVEVARMNGGQVDSRDLYAIRKTEINDIINRLSSSPNDGTKQRAAGLIASLKKSIDSAIENAGGTGWRDYIKTYENMAGGLDEMKLGKELAGKLTGATGLERKASFEAALKGAEEKVSKYTGKPMIESLSYKNLDNLNTLEKEILRDVNFDRLVAAGKKEAVKKLNTAFASKQIPNTLNATATWLNRILDVVQNKASEKTINELARIMQDPRAAAAAMKGVKPAERAAIEKIMALRYPAYAEYE